MAVSDVRIGWVTNAGKLVDHDQPNIVVVVVVVVV